MKKAFLFKAIPPLVLALLLSACSSSASSPSGTPTGGLLSNDSQTGDPPVVIAIPSWTTDLYIDNTYSDILSRLEASLQTKGFNITFNLYPPENYHGTDYYNPTVESNLDSGSNPYGFQTADAYAVTSTEADFLYKKGLTMDVGQLVTRVAPTYYSRYRSLFKEIQPGIPVGISSEPMPSKTVVLLRNDVDSDITTLDGLFQFLDEKVAGSSNIIMADPHSLIDAWAESNGYYPLSTGFLYAADNDPECTPVPLETLPGFAAFMKKMAGYYSNKELISAWNGEQFWVEYTTNKHVAGSVESLRSNFGYAPGYWLSWLNGDYTTHMIDPGQASPSYAPFARYELVLPKNLDATKADAIAHFVDWLYSSQENYDSVAYGQSGVDYTLQDEKFTPMKDGQAQNLVNITGLNKLFFTWPGMNVFVDSDYARLPAYAPSGIEDALKEARSINDTRPLPIDRKSGIDGQINSTAQEVASRRDAIFESLITLPATISDTMIDGTLAQLANQNTGLLIGEVSRLLGNAETGS